MWSDTLVDPAKADEKQGGFEERSLRATFLAAMVDSESEVAEGDDDDDKIDAEPLYN